MSKIETRGREDVSAYCAGTMILVARDTPGAEILEASRADSILREKKSVRGWSWIGTRWLSANAAR